MRDVTLEDMVSLRRVAEPRQSPDGRMVAFLVEQAFVICNCSQTALFLVPTSGDLKPRKLAQDANLSNVQWNPDGRFVTYLSAASGSVQLWSTNVENGQASILVSHRATLDQSFAGITNSNTQVPVGILNYQWSPDGRSIAFTSLPPVDKSAQDDEKRRGFLYDDERMIALSLASGDGAISEQITELWLFQTESGKELLLWRSGSSWLSRISKIAWSPESDKIAFSHSNGRTPFHDDLTVIAVSSGAEHSIARDTDAIYGIGWADDSVGLAFSQEMGDGSYGRITILPDYQSAARTFVPGLPIASNTLFWYKERVMFSALGINHGRGNAGLYSYNVRTTEIRRVTNFAEKISSCDRPLLERVSCVRQSPSDPPQPSLVRLLDGVARKLYDVNPEVGHIKLGAVTELHWKNRYGDSANGYLVMPVGWKKKQRVPVVVIGYGVDGDFVFDGGSGLTSYPVQAFARDGFAALLVNPPPYADWAGHSFKYGSRAWGFGPLASLEAILKRLSSEGIIDTTKVGFMGHSWGGFWVQFAASHSNLLRAAEIHNGGTDTEVASYSLVGNKMIRDTFHHFMGGGPYPPTYLSNYESFSASMTAGRVKIPVMIETDSQETLLSMEYFSALREHQIPVELYVYPDDFHVFVKPSHLLASMRRNLDWFEYWLVDRENRTSDSFSQYERWHELRRTLHDIPAYASRGRVTKN